MVHEIGVGALQSGGLPDSVQLDQDAVARGGLQDFLDELDVILASRETWPTSAGAPSNRRQATAP